MKLIQATERILDYYVQQTDQYVQKMSSVEQKSFIEHFKESEFQQELFQGQIFKQKTFSSICYSAAEIQKDKVMVAASRDQLNLIDLQSNSITQMIDQGNKAECLYVLKASDKKAVTSYLKPDCSLKVWDLQSFKLLSELKGHTNNVLKLLRVEDGQVLSSSLDKTIILWDIDKYQMLFKFEGHSGSIYRAFELMNANVFLSSGEGDTKIRFWDIAQRQCTKTVQHDSSFNATAILKWDENTFITGCSGLVKKWSMNSNFPLLAKSVTQKKNIESILKLNSKLFGIGFTDLGQISLISFDDLTQQRLISVGTGSIYQIILLQDNKLGVVSTDNNFYVLH